MRHRRLSVALALLAATGLAAAEAGAKNKRFGIEGEVISFDEQKNVLTVKVRSTSVEGRFASGNTVGGKAPNDIKTHQDTAFAVQPTGSVLRRTVIKGLTGGGLDTTGTPEGFKRALSAVPTDRPVVMSLEDNDPDAVAKGAPKYKILMIQVQYTEEELREHFDKISVEE